MKRISNIAAAAAALSIALAGAASARSMFDDDEAALAGAILGSEDACGLKIDLEAMDAWFDARVPAAEAADFARNVSMQVDAQTFRLRDMSAAQLRLHCRAILAKLRDAGWAAE